MYYKKTFSLKGEEEVGHGVDPFFCDGVLMCNYFIMYYAMLSFVLSCRFDPSFVKKGLDQFLIDSSSLIDLIVFVLSAVENSRAKDCKKRTVAT